MDACCVKCSTQTIWSEGRDIRSIWTTEQYLAHETITQFGKENIPDHSSDSMKQHCIWLVNLYILHFT